jgi:hypothetical protein
MLILGYDDWRAAPRAVHTDLTPEYRALVGRGNPFDMPIIDRPPAGGAVASGHLHQEIAQSHHTGLAGEFEDRNLDEPIPFGRPRPHAAKSVPLALCLPADSTIFSAESGSRDGSGDPPARSNSRLHIDRRAAVA